jgi:glyoxylase-like metal-dependent hydrolase (beta-lactamase superfamily II)
MIHIEWKLLETGYCLHPEISSREGGSWRACEFPALVALLRHPKLGWILFDTGYGHAFMDATRRRPASLYRLVTPVRWQPQQSAAAQLQARGIEPASISHVLLSHLHADHVGSLSEFSPATYWCARSALEDIRGRSRWSALSKGLLPDLVPDRPATGLRHYEDCATVRLPAELAPFGEGQDVFGDQSVLAIALPGHAAGHFGACFRAQGHWIFLVGDAAWSRRAIYDNAPPPAWATAMLGDTKAYRATLASLHALAGRRGGVVLVPAHCREARP